MYGMGIVKGMAVTMRHFIATYLDDIYWLARGGRYYNPEALSNRQSLEGRGVVTVFYPEEKLPVPERFRFVPFLVTDEPKPGEQWPHDWCTSCGICAKVCPPQCIWIVRGKLPSGRPKPEPEEFFIDIDICMNCGLATIAAQPTFMTKRDLVNQLAIGEISPNTGLKPNRLQETSLPLPKAGAGAAMKVQMRIFLL